jgi:ubiquitin-conjugating enzyme E2 variant
MPALLIDLLSVVVQAAGLILLADFIGGLFHWAEDTYGSADTPIWGPVFVQPNMVHHAQPNKMIQIHWLKNNAILFGVSALVTLVVWWAGALSWQFCVFALAAALNQQSHRFAHVPTVRLPWIIRTLQRWHILQDARHHWQHHKGGTSHYCSLTPWVNIVLDRSGFWRGVERLVQPVLGPPRAAH